MGLALLLAGCGGGPVEGRSVVTMPNTLKYTATPSGYSGEDDFNWLVINQSAFVDFTNTRLTGGKVDVTMLDSKGDIIFPQAVDGGSRTSVTITPGSVPVTQPTGTAYRQGDQWRVRLNYSNATGVVNIAATD